MSSSGFFPQLLFIYQLTSFIINKHVASYRSSSLCILDPAPFPSYPLSSNAVFFIYSFHEIASVVSTHFHQLSSVCPPPLPFSHIPPTLIIVEDMLLSPFICCHLSSYIFHLLFIIRITIMRMYVHFIS